jgi:hypothetical protein
MVLAARQMSDERDVDVLTQVHQQALRASIQEAASALFTVLSGRIAAYVVGVRDTKTVHRWAKGAVTDIRPDSESRLRAAYEIITLLLRFETPATVRAWFIGLAPELDDVSPARTIHEGRLEEAIGAARAFAANG